MTRIVTITACVACAAAAVAGCGDDNKKSKDTTAASGGATATTAATQPTAAGGAEVKVSMKNTRYVPDKVSAKVGQTITWTNDDPVPHTVTATSGAKFDSGTVNAGGTYTFKPTAAGAIKYFCTIHGTQQSGTITVSG